MRNRAEDKAFLGRGRYSESIVELTDFSGSLKNRSRSTHTILLWTLNCHEAVFDFSLRTAPGLWYISRYTNGYNVIIYGLIPRDRGDPGGRTVGRDRFRRSFAINYVSRADGFGRRRTRRTVSANRTRAPPARLTLFEYFKADPNYVVIYDGSLRSNWGRAMHGRVVYLNIRERPVYMQTYFRVYVSVSNPTHLSVEQRSRRIKPPPPPKSCSGYNEPTRGRWRQRRWR